MSNHISIPIIKEYVVRVRFSGDRKMIVGSKHRVRRLAFKGLGLYMSVMPHGSYGEILAIPDPELSNPEPFVIATMRNK